VTQHGYPYPGQPQSGPPAQGGWPQGYQQPGYGQPQQPWAPVPAPQHGYGAPVPGYGGVPQYGTAPNGAPLADVGTRFVARLIDGFILAGILLVVLVPVYCGFFFLIQNTVSVDSTGAPTGFSGASFGLLFGLIALEFILIWVAQYMYEVEFAKSTGQTVGKRVMKIRVVPLDPGRAVERGVMAKRWLVHGPGSIVPVLGLLNILWCLWDKPYRQCLHDKFAQTAVIKA
jgi:uncharacterized RDD family membrane protein YckC